MSRWCIFVSSPEEAARIVARLGGSVSSFFWQGEGYLSVVPLPEKENTVAKILSDRVIKKRGES